MPPFMQPAEFRLMWRICLFPAAKPCSRRRCSKHGQPDTAAHATHPGRYAFKRGWFCDQRHLQPVQFLGLQPSTDPEEPKGLFRDGSRTHSFKSIARFDAVAEHGRSKTPSRQPASMKTVGATKNPGKISPGFCIIQKLKMLLPWRISAAHVEIFGPSDRARLHGRRIARAEPWLMLC
jgi:hypothetical protein